MGKKKPKCTKRHPKIGVPGGVWMCPECKQVIVFKEVPNGAGQ